MNINRYTLKSWIKFAYGLKHDVNYVAAYVWGEHFLNDLPQSPTDKSLADSMNQLTDRFGSGPTIQYDSESDSLAIRLKHCSWSVINMLDQYWIEMGKTSYHHIWSGPIEILVGSFAEFDELMPFIIEQCHAIEAEKRKKQLLSDMAVATARGMIEDMVNQGLIDIPKDYVIRGTDTGRVTLYFNSPKCTISAPLDHLRARLTRRFPNI